MFIELRELLCSGAIRRHQLWAKDLLTPTSFLCKKYMHFSQMYCIIGKMAVTENGTARKDFTRSGKNEPGKSRQV